MSEDKETLAFEKEDVRVLTELGLTSLQARAYLALSTLSLATMKSVATASNIARQDVYRIMPTLQKLGLAEKVIATPALYKATPLDEGIAVLLRHKSGEIELMQTKTEHMIASFQAARLKMQVPAEDSKFLVISEKKLLHKTLDEKNNVVQESLCVSGTWESCRSVMSSSEVHKFRRALKRGVRIRWITEEHEEDPSTSKVLQGLLSSPLFEIRYFKSPIPLQTAIYDEREVVMCIAKSPSNDVNSIWSDNPKFARVALNYWEEVWNGSHAEERPKKSVRRRKGEAWKHMEA